MRVNIPQRLICSPPPPPIHTHTFPGDEHCSVLYHVFVQNGTDGIHVALTSNTTTNHGNNSIMIPGVQLPSECGTAYAQCNITAVHLDGGNLTVFIPVGGGVLAVSYSYSAGWSPIPAEFCIIEVQESCNPVAMGYIEGPTLSVLCLHLTPYESFFVTAELTLDTADICQSLFTEIGTYSRMAPPSLSNPILVNDLANCPVLSTVSTVMALVDGTNVIVASMNPTAPQIFFDFHLLGDVCPTVPHLEYYGGDVLLLRCSAASAFTFDPCHQSLQPVTNYSVSVPYPCSSWGVVAWMSPANNTVFFAYQNGTVTAPIAIGRVSEARCVNPRDPYFVYRNVNGSVYTVRIQDGSVTTLGTSWCSWPASSPVPCYGLDFTEQEGSFLVGFIDGSVYKVANLSCPSGPPTVVGLPFLPNLSTSFVGPDHQSCPCFPLAPTNGPPTSSLPLTLIICIPVVVGVLVVAVVVVCVVIRWVNIHHVLLHKNMHNWSVNLESNGKTSIMILCKGNMTI